MCQRNATQVKSLYYFIYLFFWFGKDNVFLAQNHAYLKMKLSCILNTLAISVGSMILAKKIKAVERVKGLNKLFQKWSLQLKNKVYRKRK